MFSLKTAMPIATSAVLLLADVALADSFYVVKYTSPPLVDQEMNGFYFKKNTPPNGPDFCKPYYIYHQKSDVSRSKTGVRVDGDYNDPRALEVNWGHAHWTYYQNYHGSALTIRDLNHKDKGYCLAVSPRRLYSCEHDPAGVSGTADPFLLCESSYFTAPDYLDGQSQGFSTLVKRDNLDTVVSKASDAEVIDNYLGFLKANHPYLPMNIMDNSISVTSNVTLENGDKPMDSSISVTNSTITLDSSDKSISLTNSTIDSSFDSINKSEPDIQDVASNATSASNETTSASDKAGVVGDGKFKKPQRIIDSAAQRIHEGVKVKMMA